MNEKMFLLVLSNLCYAIHGQSDSCQYSYENDDLFTFDGTDTRVDASVSCVQEEGQGSIELTMKCKNDAGSCPGGYTDIEFNCSTGIEENWRKSSWPPSTRMHQDTYLITNNANISFTCSWQACTIDLDDWIVKLVVAPTSIDCPTAKVPTSTTTLLSTLSSAQTTQLTSSSSSFAISTSASDLSVPSPTTTMSSQATNTMSLSYTSSSYPAGSVPPLPSSSAPSWSTGVAITQSLTDLVLPSTAQIESTQATTNIFGSTLTSTEVIMLPSSTEVIVHSSSTNTMTAISSPKQTDILIIYASVIPAAMFIIILAIVFSLCVVIIQRSKLQRRSIEIDWTTSFLNDNQTVIQFQKSDKISVTGSLVTIVQSLEVYTLPHNSTSDTITNEEIDDNSLPSDEAHEYETVVEPVVGNEDSTMSTAGSNVECVNYDIRRDTKRVSLSSMDGCGYVETSLEYPYKQSDTDTSSPLHCPLQPTIIIETTGDDLSLHSSYSDGYEHSASEGYITEHERNDPDYIADHTYIQSTPHHNREPNKCLESDNELYPSFEAVSMHNARINDYVFRKKMDNRLLFPVSSSSGYSSHYATSSTTNNSSPYIYSNTLENMEDASNTAVSNEV